MKKFYTILTAFTMGCVAMNAQVKAHFSSAESCKEFYKNGFDSDSDFANWTLSSTDSYKTWHLVSSSRVTGIPAFSSIDTESKQSLGIFYDDYDTQDETLTSPKMEIPAHATCSFYTCFDGVYVMYANLTLVMHLEGEDVTLFDAFNWAQETGHERPKWLSFSFDLSDYAKQQASFSFNYKGRGGDDVLIDNFVITESDDSDEAKVSVLEGASIHFNDLSEGAGLSYQWSFPGGEPASSTLPNPVVTYAEAGTYSVTLTVSDGKQEDTYTRADYVEVKGVAPTVKIGFPAEGYQSPWVASFVPLNTPIHYTDASTGSPKAWNWSFTGADVEKSTEQNPTVTYSTAGVYSVALQASNKAGVGEDVYMQAVQAGGAQYIWNIGMDESSMLDAVALGWYGYYGGTNWLDLLAFAERFEKPAQKGSISEVGIYFAVAETVTPDADIRVAIARDEAGLPGEELAVATVKAGDLAYDATTYVMTPFKFAEPVAVDDAFFVTVSGFPNNMDELTYEMDDIAMACAPIREEGGKATAYHYLYDYDDDYQPVGDPYWVVNEESPTSFAITPLFTYGEVITALQVVATDAKCSVRVVDGRLEAVSAAAVKTVMLTDMAGRKVAVAHGDSLSTAGIGKGLYMVSVTFADGSVKSVKVLL